MIATATRCSAFATKSRLRTSSSAPGSTPRASIPPGWAHRSGSRRRQPADFAALRLRQHGSGRRDPGRHYRVRGAGPGPGAPVLVTGRPGARRVRSVAAAAGRHRGPPRDVRAVQPVLSMSGPPACPADPLVRRVRPDELNVLMPACVAMFTEEVGVSPMTGDGGATYRARVSELIRAGRAFARIENGRVIFKAEIGSVTPHVCQVQGVWVDPERRGAAGCGRHGLGRAGSAAQHRPGGVAVRQRLQRPRSRRVPAGGIRAGRYVHVRVVLISRTGRLRESPHRPGPIRPHAPGRVPAPDPARVPAPDPARVPAPDPARVPARVRRAGPPMGSPRPA